MIRIDKEDIRVEGDFDVIIKEWVALNIELADNIAKSALNNSDSDVGSEEYKKIAVSVLDDLHKDCVEIMEKEILK